MTIVDVTCSFCRRKYKKELRRFNEAKKFGWKFYCSARCLSLGRNKQKTFNCANPSCNNVIRRAPHEIPLSGFCFCSKSCAAVINNPKSPKRRTKIKTCPVCGEQFTGQKIYCSRKCQIIRLKEYLSIPKEKLLNTIKEFYRTHGRIPFKKEFFHAKAARRYFGTWNKAIEAAGFSPNPVRFAKKYTANDGHKCDSLAEKIIDDWLYARKIIHLRNFRYDGTKFSADFKIGNIFIEFFGLNGQLRRYDELLKQKLNIVKKNNLKLISIYPNDLFPQNRLDKLLGELLKI